jgi:hypothetical protein
VKPPGASGASVAGPIWWDRSMFATGPDMSVPCPEILDVTGRHRVLVFGPMKVLPAGSWRLGVRFGLSSEAAGHDYILQFVHGEALAERWFRPTAGGEFEVEISNAFSQDALAALRLWNARALFYGELRFHGATATRLKGRPPAEGASVSAATGGKECE